MKVEETADLGDGHTIEFGRATWDEERPSVRNRYETSTGGFSPHSSSEIPLGDVKLIVEETAKQGLFSPEDARRMIVALTDALVAKAEEAV